MKKYTEIRGILTQNDEHMIMTGMPKLDALKNGGLCKDKVLEKFGLDSALPIILQFIYNVRKGGGNKSM